jgi:pimeloyl-ACP methyl ester carboxylesterase
MPVAVLPSGIDLAYELHGIPGACPLVLLHGHGSRGSTFADFLPLIEDQFYILTPDLRGHGESSKPLGSTYEETLDLYTIDQFSRDICELVTNIEFPIPFVLAGHSMGGMIAQDLAVESPGMVSHLILAGTAAWWYTDGRAAMLDRLKDGSIPLDEAFFNSSVPIGLTRAFRKAHPDLVASSVQSRLLVPRDVYIAAMENTLFRYDTRDRLPDLAIPTLIFTGDKDGIVEPARSEELQDLIPGAKLVVVPGQNHGLFHEVPDLVAAEMKAFINC